MNKIDGLSILIPVYNFDIRNLAITLSRQASALNTPVEIICIDDNGHTTFKNLNREISAYPHIKYIEEPFNRGRSAIRNHLAQIANHNYLLFLDCDSEINQKDFLINYLQPPNAPVKVGGTLYCTTPPQDKTYLLHWLNGSKREVKTASARMQNPYTSLTLNNILIEKKIYNKILLDEKITGYGHEDTKFGYDLFNSKIDILHIDNAVYHIGLNSTDSFILKTIESVRNLYEINKREQKSGNTKLFKVVNFLHKTRSHKAISAFLLILRPFILRNLKSKVPSLIALDLLKLSELLVLSNKK